MFKLFSIRFAFVVLISLCCSHAAYATRIAIISDLNSSYGSLDYHSAVGKAVQRIVQLQPDLVISTGDMIAGQRIRPLLTREEIEDMWQSFHSRVTVPLKTADLELAVTPGNHDASGYGRYNLERRIYAEQWRMKKPALAFVDDHHYPFYYAFKLGDTLLISLDATTPGSLEAKQKQWLNNLLTTEGTTYARRILFSHVPLWPFSQQRETEALFDTDLEKLLQKHKVDMYLSGHHHSYYPGYKEGVRYVSQACLGSGPRKLIGDTKRSPRSITIIDIPDKGPISVNAYTAPDYIDPVSLQSLPRKIVSPRATLLREDIGLATEGTQKP